MKRRGVLLVLGLSCFSACASCQGSMGTITNPRKELHEFVSERTWVWYVSATGTHRIRLDGTGQDQFLPPGFFIEDVSADGAVFAVGDQETNVYVLREQDRELRRVPEPALAGRVSEVALRPDGRSMAVARHADFDTPQSTWRETKDDQLFLVDTEVLTARSIPPSMKAGVLALAWAADGEALWLRTETTNQRIDADTGERRAGLPWPTERLVPGWRARQTTCPGTGEIVVEREEGADEGLELQSPSNGTRALVTVQGRERGFHDYLPTIDHFFFTGSCRYVVFEHDRTIYVVDVSSGDVGVLAEGTEPFTLARGQDSIP